MIKIVDKLQIYEENAYVRLVSSIFRDLSEPLQVLVKMFLQTPVEPHLNNMTKNI